MKKMKLLSVLKSVRLLVIVVVSNACAMELVTYQSQAEKFVREFPLMTLRRAHYRYNDCNARAKAEIEKKITEKEDECFAGIFNAATKMPVDASMEIIKQLFNKKMAPTKKFLKMPIKDAFETYAWTQDVYDGKEAKEFIGSLAQLVKKEMFDNGDLFQYCNEIKRINDYAAQRKLAQYKVWVDRELLEILNMFNKKIKDINQELGCAVGGLSFYAIDDNYKGMVLYRYCDEYTGKNFLNKFKNRGEVGVTYLICAVPIITAWLSRYIELNWCQKMLTDGDMQWNKEAIIFNEGLKWAKTQQYNINAEILPYLHIDFKDFRSLIGEYYSRSDLLKINTPFFTVLPALVCAAFAIDSFKNKRFDFYVPDSTRIIGTIIFDSIFLILWGGGPGVLLKMLSWLRDDDFPLGFLGVFTSVSVGFLGLACVKTLWEMRAWQGSSVILDDIDQLLKQCHDEGIVIE